MVVHERLPSVDRRALTLLSPVSGGCGLNGPMRLVALLLMVWEDDSESGRIEWDHDQISDRTGLSVAMVADALDKLRQIELVKETAAGPRLTWEPFSRNTLPAWRDAHMLRPKPQSGSPSQATEEPDGNDQVAQREADQHGSVRGGSRADGEAGA